MWTTLFIFTLLFSPSSPLSSLFKKMELMEACQYGLVEQVHYFIKTGVNVNMADFVSCVSTREGRIMYMNSRWMHLYCQNVAKRWRIQSWDDPRASHWASSSWSIQLDFHRLWAWPCKASNQVTYVWASSLASIAYDVISKPTLLSSRASLM